MMERQWMATRRALLCGTAAAGAVKLALPAAWAAGRDRPEPSERAIVMTREAFLAPGISEALARGRAGRVTDLAYDVALDLTGTGQAAGSTTIAFTLKDNREHLILDFRGTSLDNLSINGRAVADLVRENGHVILPAALLKKGANRLSATFVTPVAPSGSAIIQVDDKSDGTTYLYTLLVPSDAHQLMPCFDQPDLKGRIAWTITAPKEWTVIGNSKVVAKDEVGAARRWTFGRTPPIPLYVTSFAAGPWRAFPSTPPGKRPITLYARPSRAPEMDVEPFIATNRATIEWLEDWLASPFPFEKLDLVLAPAFPFGGMEHVGAVFYNETGTIFREPPTLSQSLNRDQTIYHELSHQWFGDYVTMKWFDDLWLKEGFSTFISCYVQEALQPETQPWKTFFVRLKSSAYNTDASSGTTPLWQQLDNLSQAGSNYGPIVYNKAPAVLKQLAFLVGDKAFRKGLQIFVRRHAYGNATWRDLLSAIELASGQSLKTFGERYVLQPGVPRVRTKLELQGDRIQRLTLSQSAENVGAGTVWPMRLQIRLGYKNGEDVVIPATLDQGELVVAKATGLPAPDYVWANDGDFGYAIFELDRRSATWVQAWVNTVEDPLLRAMLWGGLWDDVRDGRLAPLDFARIAIRHLPGESDEQVAAFIQGRAATAVTHYADPQSGAAFVPEWENFLSGRSADPKLAYGVRKQALDGLLATARSPAGLNMLRAYLDGTRQFDGAAIRQASRWAAVTQLLACGTVDAKARYEAEARRDKEPDAARSAYVALASSTDAEIKERYFRAYIDDKSLNEGWAIASFAAFNDPKQNEMTSRFLPLALERLEWIKANRSIVFLPTWINGFIKNRTSASDLKVIDTYLAGRPDLAIDIRRKLLEARDDVARTVRIRTMT